MKIIKLMEWYNRTDVIISDNNDRILEWKKLAMLFLGDSEADKNNREICIIEARKIKAESDKLLKEKDELTTALQLLSPLHRQILEMFYINGIKATVCCDILNCSLSQFYSWKKKAVQELERKMEEDAHSDI